MIKFIWNRLIHAPLPSKLVHVDYYWLKNCVTGINVNLEPVKVLVSISFKIESFSPNFCYQGRTIATPFLSVAGLENPAIDRRLLGSSVYWASLSRFGSCSFENFFTGADDLGLYDFWSGAYKAEHILSKYAVVKYYVVDPFLEDRISRFFNRYEQARNFAEKLFASSHGEVKAFFLIPVTVRSCVRCLNHPIGIFACVPTMTGSINASELLFEFRSRLMLGGDN